MELRQLLRETICRTADCGVENAGFEARQILEKAGISPVKLISEPNAAVDEKTARAVGEMLEKRENGVPLQYILGEWEFFGLPFKVGEGVLIPRQDTETAAEICADFLKFTENARVLDLCAGSGCIGIALAKTCGARAVLVEKSEKAFRFLEENIRLNGVEELCEAVLGDVFGSIPIEGNFDVIVSNPPYLSAKDMENLQREVSFEPREALYGGEDGLDFYKIIVEKYKKYLARGGLFAAEIGINQEKNVGRIFAENDFEAQFAKDLRGIVRVVYGINVTK